MNKLQISFGTPLIVIHQQSGPLRAAFTVTIGSYSFEGENMAATMQAGSRATVSVEWKDTSGHIVKVDGPTSWASSVPGTVQCTVSTGNPQIANLHAPGPVGSAQIQATADADLGEGKKAITATLEVSVIAGEAIGGDITFKPTPAR